MFQSVSSSTAIALGVKRPSPSATIAIDVECVVSEIYSTEFMLVKELSAFVHALYMTIVVPVRKSGNSTTISRSPEKHRLNNALKTATTVAKDDNASDVIEAV